MRQTDGQVMRSVRLDSVLAGLPVRTRGAADVRISGVTDDSRRAVPGCLFVARPGAAHDGRAYVADAIARGAVAVLRAADVHADAPAGVTLVDTEDLASVGPAVAHRFHGDPTRSLAVVGVTGTNGKTTIAYLTQQLLAAAGRRTGLVGTVETDDGARRVKSALTTPGAFELAELFGAMRSNGCTHAAIEVSSHALDQGRVQGVRFACGIFTNLTGDHLDYHGTMEAYAAAKAKLFDSLDANAWRVLNADDPWSGRMDVGRSRRLRCSLADARADCLATIHDVAIDGMRVTLRGPWGSLAVRLPLVGQHNACNALQAAAAAWSQGVPAEALAAALERCAAPPGRLQPVGAERAADRGFSVLVDYAHTDDALLNVLLAVRPSVAPGGAVRVVFGCGGDRDRSKRPRMAAVACAHADHVVVTSDNPRTEDPRSIVDDILAGVPAGTHVRVDVEVDRTRAIELAVGAARRGDIILVAGKGHEDYQIVGTERRPFDDRLVARDALERLTAERVA